MALSSISSLTALHLNRLSPHGVTGTGLAAIAKLTGLKALTLGDALDADVVQAEQLQVLAALSALEMLHLSRTTNPQRLQQALAAAPNQAAADAAVAAAAAATLTEDRPWGPVMRHFTHLRALSLQVSHSLESQVRFGAVCLGVCVCVRACE